MRRLAALTALWIAAAVWFVPGVLVTLDDTDEGQLVYFSSRVAEGALPYRDFHHIYGPSVFFLNGGLLALAGQDLLAVRLGLVAVKATLSVAVAVLGAAGGSRWGGLLAWGLLVSAWGMPVWLFATPYASIYQTAFDLLGLVALVTLHGKPRRRGLVTGLCLGLAATFKQSTGTLVGLGVIAYLIHEGGVKRAAGADDRDPLAVGVRLALLALTLAVAAVYTAAISEAPAVVLLGVPLVLLVLAVGTRVARDRGRPRDDLMAVGWTVVGAAVAPAAYLVYYAACGAAGQLVGDTLWGLPQKIILRMPLPSFAGAPALELTVAGLGLAMIELGRRAAGTRGSARAAYAGAAASAAAALIGIAGGPEALFRLFRDGPWPVTLSLTVVFWVPPVITWIAVARLLASGSTPGAVAAPVFLAASVLPSLQPVGDLPHAFLALPAFLPSLAQLATWYANRRWPGRWIAGAAMGALAAALATSFVRPLGGAFALLAAPGFGYQRATGVRDPGPFARDTRALVTYLERTPADTRLLTLPTRPIILFLADRRSPLDLEEFPFILGTGSQVSQDDARALVDEDAAIARLEHERALVVRVRNDPNLAAMRRVFPKLIGFVEARFREVARFGRYEVLALTEPDGSPRTP